LTGNDTSTLTPYTDVSQRCSIGAPPKLSARDRIVIRDQGMARAYWLFFPSGCLIGILSPIVVFVLALYFYAGGSAPNVTLYVGLAALGLLGLVCIGIVALIRRFSRFRRVFEFDATTGACILRQEFAAGLETYSFSVTDCTIVDRRIEVYMPKNRRSRIGAILDTPNGSLLLGLTNDSVLTNRVTDVLTSIGVSRVSIDEPLTLVYP